MQILISLFLFFSPYAVNAEVANYQTAHQSYLSAQEEYSQQHSEYLLAKSQYNQAGTLAAETKAREETAQMLSSRDKVLSTYLETIKARLVETNGLSDTTKNGLISRLDSEINWYQNHSDRVSSAGTLNDLVEDSEEARDHKDQTTTPLVYENLVTIPVTKVSVLRRDASVIISDLKNFLNDVESAGNHDVSEADRWMIQIDGKITRSIDKEIDAQNQLQTLQNPDKKTNYSSIYDSGIQSITESHQFIKEANTFLGEVIRLIRTNN